MQNNRQKKPVETSSPLIVFFIAVTHANTTFTDKLERAPQSRSVPSITGIEFTVLYDLHQSIESTGSHHLTFTLPRFAGLLSHPIPENGEKIKCNII